MSHSSPAGSAGSSSADSGDQRQTPRQRIVQSSGKESGELRDERGPTSRPGRTIHSSAAAADRTHTPSRDPAGRSLAGSESLAPHHAGVSGTRAGNTTPRSSSLTQRSSTRSAGSATPPENPEQTRQVLDDDAVKPSKCFPCFSRPARTTATADYNRPSAGRPSATDLERLNANIKGSRATTSPPGGERPSMSSGQSTRNQAARTNLSSRFSRTRAPAAEAGPARPARGSAGKNVNR
jgi:hypothetical protein